MQTVVLRLKPAVEITFDLGTLMRIEESTGKSVVDTVMGWVDGQGVDEAGNLAVDGAKMARKLSVTYMAAFLAACVQCPVADLAKRVPFERIGECFMACMPAFAAAVVAMLPKGEETAASPPVAGSAESPPGPASSAESAVKSS